MKFNTKGLMKAGMPKSEPKARNHFFKGAITQSRLQKNAIACIMLLGFSFPAFSMQSPWSQKWKKIDTKIYRIIYPAGAEKLAQRVANLMEYYSPHLRKTIKTKARRIPVVLINQYASANGFVSPAPFYSHWFSTPSSFDGLEWFHGLAIHEGRHMVQMDKMKDGAGKYTWRILGGANGTGALIGLYLPMWFLEGDAVVTETALTSGGRGRMPSFDMWHRALELSGKRYSYHRAYLGGYNDALPYADYYRLGYLICSHVRKTYGADVWNRVLDRVGKYFLFQNFDSALKSETGKSIDAIYHDAMEDYYRLWKRQLRGLTMTDADILSPSGNGTWSGRFFPLQTETENVLSIRWSRDDTAALVRIKRDGSEEKLVQVPASLAGSALINEKGMSAGGGKVLWRESVPDLRWGYRSYNDLVLYDVASKKKKRITTKGKFISSAISRDGKQAIGISYGPDLIYRLFVYDTSTGIKIREITLGKGTHYFDSAFGAGGKEIIAATLAVKGKGVAAISLESGRVRNVIPPVNDENFRSPFSYGRYVLYSSDYSGIDNIYALDRATEKRYQVTCRPLGAFNPSVSPDGKKILFSDYSVNGYRAAAMSFNPAEWKPLRDVERRALNYIDPVVKQEAGQRLDVDEQVPNKKFKESGYSPALHSINIYGWFPVIDLTQVDFRFMIQSLDVMQTTAVNVSYIFNMNELTHGGEAGITYAGLYPVFNIFGGYGQRAAVVKAADKIADSEMMRWDEGYVVGEVLLPLNFSRGIHSTWLNISAGAGYINVQSKTRPDYSIYGMADDGDLQFLSYNVSLFHYVQGSSIAVGPRWGQVFSGYYKHTPFYGSYRGEIVSADMIFYFPGLFKSHNISLAGGYEYQKPGDSSTKYYFTSYFLHPRGYTLYSYENLVKGSFDYNLPVLNVNGPSWDIPYIKRILGTVFFDYGYTRDGGIEKNYRSTGIELLAELHILGNAFLSFAIGGRYSYCIDGNEHVVSLAFRSLIPDPYYRGKMKVGR